jgi:hypothetical protein
MNIADLGITSVAAVTVIVFLVCQAVKATKLDNKWLPVIAGASGAVLGVIGMMTMPGYPATDYLTAAAVGIVSGLAATGINQAYKQLSAGGGSNG